MKGKRLAIKWPSKGEKYVEKLDELVEVNQKKIDVLLGYCRAPLPSRFDHKGLASEVFGASHHFVDEVSFI